MLNALVSEGKLSSKKPKKISPLKRALVALLALSVVALPAAATASHYRSVYTTTSKAGGIITWTSVNATESGDPSSFSDTADIDLLTSSSDAYTSGTDTALDFVEISSTEDLSNSLYASTTQVYTADVSTLADGFYEAYSETCCRLDGIQNTSGQSSVSSWIRFTVASGVPNLPPVFNQPSLYELIAPNGTVSADFTATDPEAGAVTYTLLTDTSSPTYAGSAIPCSTFAAGVLTIGAAHCSGGDVFVEIFDADNPDYNGDIPSWVAKVEAKDAQGNVATSDVLFRLMAAPEPYINDDTWIGGSDYELDIIAPDTSSDVFSVECVNDADANDIVVDQGSSSPLTVRNLAVGETYTCTPYAENAAGGNFGDTYELGPVQGILLDLNLVVGAEFSGATTNIVGGGLKPSSEYTLTMYSDPIEIYAGTTDPDGNFNEIITLPEEVCIAGVQHLILLGTDTNDQPVSDEQWVEIAANCEVMRISATEFEPTLADTGFDSTSTSLLGVILLASGTGLVVARRRIMARN